MKQKAKFLCNGGHAFMMFYGKIYKGSPAIFILFFEHYVINVSLHISININRNPMATLSRQFGLDLHNLQFLLQTYAEMITMRAQYGQ